MKIDFNFPLTGLDGVAFDPEQNAGKHLATALASQSRGNVVKLWDWAVKMNKGDAVELDNADWDTLKTLIEESQSLTIVSKYQLLEAMKNAKVACTPQKSPQ